MTTESMIIPVSGGLYGMNKLAQFLNSVPLTGNWHFASRTRFDQTSVTIDFDNPVDLASTQNRYRATHSDLA